MTSPNFSLTVRRHRLNVRRKLRDNFAKPQGVSIQLSNVTANSSESGRRGESSRVSTPLPCARPISHSFSLSRQQTRLEVERQEFLGGQRKIRVLLYGGPMLTYLCLQDVQILASPMQTYLPGVQGTGASFESLSSQYVLNGKSQWASHSVVARLA